MDYISHIFILVAIYATLAISLELLAGQTGLLSIAQAAFFGVGGYATALLATQSGTPFFVSVLVGMAIAVLVSFIISSASLRLHDDYFIMTTLGFQIIVSGIFNNWMELTHGPLGIAGIPPPVIFGWRVVSHLDFLILATAVVGFAYTIVWRLTTSPFGRVLHAVREDEVFVKALGKNTLGFKVTAFAVSAALAASAGSVYASYITYIAPTSFTVVESILIISMVIIGGAGSLWGALVGAFLLVTLPEVLRFVGLPDAVAANLRQIIYGGLLVIIMVFRPCGFIGKYGFNK